jgi:predicted ribosomally synthesized peptide with nif11-like leader
MKTVEEFIQRLQDDPEFERKARAFENSDEFMEFVKSAGYDFTLDQLLVEFHHEPELPKQPAEPADGPPTTLKNRVISIPRMPDGAALQKQADPALRGVVEPQKRLETLSPKFEGVGGRRRGMKWRNVDRDET